MATTSACEKCGQRGPFTVSGPLASHGNESSAAALRTALAEIHSQITHHKEYIAALEDERDQLEVSLQRVAYPVLTLPAEITSQIFVGCLPDHGRVRPSPKTAPLSLLRVCRAWREIALSTCQLWSSLDLIRPPRQINSLETWFARAKGHSLSLTFRSWSPTISSQALSKYSGQLRRLELELSPEDFCEIHSPFPVLHYLGISAKVQEEDLGALFEIAPSLRELRLFSYSSPFTFVLPLLTTLEIDRISMAGVLGVLESSPLLSQLKFSLNGWIAEETAPKVFAGLRSLSLGSSSTIPILQYLTLPNLNRLEIHKALLEEVTAFISRSSCIIKHLVCRLSDCNWSLLREWLSTFPSLATLEVDMGENINILLLSLLPMFCDPVLLQLTDITIATTIVDIDYELVIEFIGRRRVGVRDYSGYKLRSFHLATSGQGGLRTFGLLPGKMAEAELERIHAEGFDFDIHFRRDDITGSHNHWHWPADLRDDDDDPCQYFPTPALDD